MRELGECAVGLGGGGNQGPLLLQAFFARCLASGGFCGSGDIVDFLFLYLKYLLPLSRREEYLGIESISVEPLV